MIHRYINPTPGFISLIADSSDIGSQSLDNALCQELKDCGFNAVMLTVNPDRMKQTLDDCSVTGIRALVHTDDMHRYDSDAFLDFVRKYSDNKSLGGWLYSKSVSYDDLVLKKSNYDSTLATDDNESKIPFVKRYDKLFKTDPSRIVIVTLKQFAGFDCAGTTYRNYMEECLRLLNPSPLVYSFYPVGENGENRFIKYDDFFKNLQIFSLLSEYSGAPVWTYLNCMPDNASVNQPPSPTYEELKFIAFSALAYGAQGLICCTDGLDSETRDAVSRLNREITGLNIIFHNSSLAKCKHTGDYQYSGTCKYEREAFGPLLGVSRQPSILTKPYETGILLSLLNTEGRNYLVIVNHCVTAKQTFQLRFSSYYKTQRVYLGENFNLKYQDLSSFEDWYEIEPAGYLIFEWEE